MDTLSSVNKKLLARICQESSDPVNGAGTVVANSIAALDSSDLNRFWQMADRRLLATSGAAEERAKF
jgi:hypothetical protein